jgi:hypothetical protein
MSFLFNQKLSGAGVADRYIHEDLEAIQQAVNLVPRLPKP